MKYYIAGHRGMVGSAILRKLQARGETIITANHDTLDLRDQSAVRQFIDSNKPDYVVLAAARVGGIQANNTYPADFIYDNLMIQTNIIHETYKAGIGKLLFLGSSCIYPKHAEQPMTESALLSGALEPTNEPYAIAKIAGIKLCESYNRQHNTDFRSVMPTNLYGPNDNFHPENSHVIPSLLRRIYQASLNNEETVTVWGSGNPRREFLHVDDMAEASIFVMDQSKESHQTHTKPTLSHINIGTGVDVSIKELALMIAEITGYKGRIAFDTSKPDGPPRKLLDVHLINQMGWQAGITLRDGLVGTLKWYKAKQDGDLRGIKA